MTLLPTANARQHHCYMKPQRRPGDLLLDRYLKGADEETRERAREAFREFARALEQLGEEVAGQLADSREHGPCGRIPSLNPEA